MGTSPDAPKITGIYLIRRLESSMVSPLNELGGSFHIVGVVPWGIRPDQESRGTGKCGATGVVLQCVGRRLGMASFPMLVDGLTGFVSIGFVSGEIHELERTRTDSGQVHTGFRVVGVQLFRGQTSAGFGGLTDSRYRSVVDDPDCSVLVWGTTRSHAMVGYRHHFVRILRVFLRWKTGRHPLSPRSLGGVHDDRHPAWRTQRLVRQIPASNPRNGSSHRAMLVLHLPDSRVGAFLCPVAHGKNRQIDLPLAMEYSHDRNHLASRGFFLLRCHIPAGCIDFRGIPSSPMRRTDHLLRRHHRLPGEKHASKIDLYPDYSYGDFRFEMEFLI